MAKRTLTSIEIPQADSLENVRRVVEAIAAGASSRKEIADKTDISLRHIDYAIHAAKSLGFLPAGESLSVTDTGRSLAGTERGADAEREQLRAAFKVNEVLEMLAPDLLEANAPAKSALAERIQKACPDLSEATAARRAQTLLAWRSQALGLQIPPADAQGMEAKPVEKAAPAPKKVAAKKAAPAPKKAAAAKPVAKKAAPAPKKAAAAAKPVAKKAAPAPKKAAAAAKPAAKKAAAAPKKAAAAAAKPAAKRAAAAPKKAAAKPAKKAAKVASGDGAPAQPVSGGISGSQSEGAAPERQVVYEPNERGE